MRQKKNLKELYNDINNFIEGEVNNMMNEFGILDEEKRLIAEERQKVCLSCDKLNKEEEKCNLCGCHFPSLTYSIEGKHCPEGKWENGLEDKIEENGEERSK